MATLDEIRERISACAAGNRRTLKAMTFIQKFGSASRPVIATCDDGAIYVIKGAHNGRTLVTEHVVGRLGELMGAPVGEVAFAEITDELRQVEPQLADVSAGLGHATRWVPDCTDKLGVDHMDKSYNRQRFALLQVLYSWALAGDHQLIYSKSDPFLVLSVDHGHFLNGSTGWSAASLRGCGPPALDPYFAMCGLPASALVIARAALAAITDSEIRLVAGGPPDAWGTTPDDRAAIAEYFIRRRDQLVAILPQ